MTLPALPPQGSTSWYAWVSGLDGRVRNDLSDEALRSALLAKWAPNINVTANAYYLSPNGEVIKRTASGVTRATYDATEAAAWTVITAAGGGGGGNVPNGTAVGQVPVWSGTAYTPTSVTDVVAADVPFTPVGDVAATNVQAAIAELDTEKMAGLEVQDEGGTPFLGVRRLDFQGAGVTATSGTGKIVVTVPGAASSTAAPARNPTPQASNLKGWAVDPSQVGTSVTTGVANQLYLSRILVPESVSLANVHFVVGTTAPVAVANAYAAIIGSDGTVLAQSADVSASLNGTPASTAFTAPLASAVTVGGQSQNAYVYAAFGFGGATTAPSFAAIAASAASNAAMNTGLSVGAYRFAYLSNTAWPLGATVALSGQTQTATNKNIWMAVS